MRRPRSMRWPTPGSTSSPGGSARFRYYCLRTVRALAERALEADNAFGEKRWAAAGRGRARRRTRTEPLRWQALRTAPSGRAAGSSQQELVYHLALYSDLREAGAGCLPPGIEGFENRTVEGKFVLQVLPLSCASGP